MATSGDRQRVRHQSGFGDTLQRLRLAADLTQEELAERAGVSARLISDIERGIIRRSRRDTVNMLADGLQLAGDERDAFSNIARGKRQPGPVDAAHQVRIPIAADSIIGREREISATTSLLLQPETRLLTLTGPGGVGKTRLALETTHRAARAFPAGATFVDLSALADHGLVLPTVRQALGIEDSRTGTPLEQLVAALAARRMLLTLDNLEHLPGAAPAIGRLLEQCPELTILATSRQVLHLRAEREYNVQPLILPDLNEQASLTDLGRVPAIELFIHRAETVRPGFVLTGENATTVAEIVVRLDGLPLAIGLAAARLRVLSPGDLLARLERRLPLLTAGPLDAPDRHQTLRATIDWSYHLLGPDEQVIFRNLSVFAGGFTLEAAEATTSQLASQSLTLLDLISSLVDKHLLQRVEDTGSRFQMLETIREYALEQLAASGNEIDARTRHAAWCIQLAEQSLTELTGANQRQWFTRMEREHDNLRAALDFSILNGFADMALEITGSLYRFWEAGGHYAEGLRWTERALAMPDSGPSIPRASSLLGSGVLAFFQGDYDDAEAVTTHALRMYQQLGDATGTAYGYGNLGMLADVREDYPLAIERYTRALNAFRELGDEVHTSFMLANLGLIHYFQQQYEQALKLFQEALVFLRARNDRNGVAVLLGNIGNTYRAQGRPDRAAELHRETLNMHRESGHRNHLVRNIEMLGLDAVDQRDWRRAARLFGACEALRIDLGTQLPPNDYQEIETALSTIRSRIGPERLAEQLRAGADMSVDDAVEYALEADPGRESDRYGVDQPGQIDQKRYT